MLVSIHLWLADQQQWMKKSLHSFLSFASSGTILLDQCTLASWLNRRSFWQEQAPFQLVSQSCQCSLQSSHHSRQWTRQIQKEPNTSRFLWSEQTNPCHQKNETSLLLERLELWTLAWLKLSQLLILAREWRWLCLEFCHWCTSPKSTSCSSRPLSWKLEKSLLKVRIDQVGRHFWSMDFLCCPHNPNFWAARTVRPNCKEKLCRQRSSKSCTCSSYTTL